jgi:Acetokinase family
LHLHPENRSDRPTKSPTFRRTQTVPWTHLRGTFFSTLKNELVHDRDYHTRDEARADVAVATGRVGAWLRERLPGAVPVAVGHRVAHGGPDYRAPVAVDNDILAALERLVPLAPMHQPYNLRPIRTIQERFLTMRTRRPSSRVRNECGRKRIRC